MRIRRSAAALAAATLLLATGCGDESSDDAGSSSASRAEESADASASAEPSADSEVDAAAFGQALVDAQLEAGTVHMRGTVGPGMEMTGEMDLSADKPAMDMTMSGAQLGGEARMILVGDAMYMRVPGAGMGNKYLKVDASDPDNPLARALQSMDPSSSFKAFEAVTSLERVGEDTIGGVPTEHYTVTVDTEKSLRAQGIDPRQAGGQLPPEVTYDVWVGEDELIRKMVMGPEAGGIELLLSKWGEPVQISAPPPGQVREMPQPKG